MRKLLCILAALLCLHAGSVTAGGTASSTGGAKPQKPMNLLIGQPIISGTQPVVVSCGKYKAVPAPGGRSYMNMPDCASVPLPSNIRIRNQR